MPTLPPTNIRWDVTVHLVDLLRAHPSLAGVQVEPGWPGDEVRAESIWVGDLDGAVDIPVMSAGRKYRDDQWTIPFQVAVSNRADLDATVTRLSQLVAAVEDVLADDPTLADFDGLLSASMSSMRMTCGRTPQGHIGAAEITVACHARLS